VWLTTGLLKKSVSPNVLEYLVLTAALMSIVGHNFSVFLGFKGGKGVATSLGVIIALAPAAAAVGFGLWVIVVAVFRYISVASIAASVSVPIFMHYSVELFGRPVPGTYQVCAVVAALFILVKHRSNLKRLRDGTEPRIGEKIRIGGGQGGS